MAMITRIVGGQPVTYRIGRVGQVSGGGTPPDPDPDPPGGEWSGTKTVFAASYGSTGGQTEQATRDLDADMAAAVGQSTPFFAGRHSYSGNSFPATFAQTSAGDNPDYGWPYTVLNVKTPWNQLANGAFDQHIEQFIDSIPVGHTCYLVINHEPENDDDPLGPEVWCTGQARAANLIASLDDPRCHMGVCHMSFTWRTAQRNPEDWNPVTGGTITMNANARDRTIFSPDGYTEILNASGTNYRTMQDVFSDPYASAASWGFQRFAINEHALNNDINAPVSAIVNIWESNHLPWINSQNLEYYAGYSSEGPAAGTNARLDTPEELQTIGNWVYRNRYGLI